MKSREAQASRNCVRGCAFPFWVGCGVGSECDELRVPPSDGLFAATGGFVFRENGTRTNCSGGVVSGFFFSQNLQRSLVAVGVLRDGDVWLCSPRVIAVMSWVTRQIVQSIGWPRTESKCALIKHARRILSLGLSANRPSFSDKNSSVW
jgi:hypothetical protein